MYFIWLLIIYLIFGVVGGVLLIGTKFICSKKLHKVCLAIPGIICVVIAAVSLVLFFFSVTGGQETGNRKMLNSENEIIFITKAGPNSEGKYYAAVGEQYVYTYYDKNEELQTGYADIEDSKEYTGHLNGRACVLITTNEYNAEFQWWYFVGAYRTITEKTYEFYTP